MAPNARRRFDPTGSTAPQPTPLLLLLLASTAAAAVASASTSASTSAAAPARYTNQFAVRVAGFGGDVHTQADALARKHGFVNRGQVSRFSSTCGLHACATCAFTRPLGSRARLGPTSTGDRWNRTQAKSRRQNVLIFNRPSMSMLWPKYCSLWFCTLSRIAICCSRTVSFFLSIYFGRNFLLDKLYPKVTVSSFIDQKLCLVGISKTFFLYSESFFKRKKKLSKSWAKTVKCAVTKFSLHRFKLFSFDLKRNFVKNYLCSLDIYQHDSNTN